MSQVVRAESSDREEDEAPNYRVFALDDEGKVNASTLLSVANDDSARVLARRMAKGFAIELWDGLRFIEHYDSRVTA